MLFCLLFVYFEYTMFPSHDMFVVINISSPAICHVPMSSGVSVALSPVGEFFDTLICISFCFIVLGLIPITPLLFPSHDMANKN